jgi:hypothetical protein
MTFFGVKTGRIILITALTVMSFLTKADLIFEENFDGQPDFTSTMYTTKAGQEVWNGNILPEGWDTLFQGTRWSPETGFPDNHASLEILVTNADKARGRTGKSMVNWRESYDAGWNNWASDSQMMKMLDREYTELYIEYWISFSENFYSRASDGSYQSKISRVGYFDGVGDPYNGAAGAIGPMSYWQYNHNNYGMRNTLSFRGGPAGENYSLDTDSAGIDVETNYGSKTIGMAVGGGNPRVVDQINGGFLADVDRYSWISHGQLFGPPGHWTKMAFYYKMNSSPGVADGVLMQWVNGQRIKIVEGIPWIGLNIENKMVGWNYVAIGGNDFFRPYPNEDRFEDWYSIDDLVVRSSMPEDLLSGVLSVPNPPSGLTVQ